MFEKIAKSIAQSTAEVIGYGVLVTDDLGVIIGCDDESRLGASHSPSIRVIADDISLITSSDDAREMEGVFPGYTLPIHFSGRVIGSVSITGPPDDVKRYGQLVQKQAEMMLREQALIESTLMREKALSDLIENITFFDGGNISRDVIVQQGIDLGFDLSKCGMALSAEMRREINFGVEQTAQSYLREARGVFSNPSDIICLHSDQTVSILMACGPKGLKDIETRAERKAGELVSSAYCKGIKVNVAIGLPAEGLGELSESLRAARTAMRIGTGLGMGGVLMAKDFIVESLLDSIPREARDEFAARTLKELYKRSDFEEIKKTFLTWCGSPFSPSSAAEKLSLHRNSLQYRLKKIRNVTGKDPWNFKDAFELWAAFIITNMR